MVNGILSTRSAGRGRVRCYVVALATILAGWTLVSKFCRRLRYGMFTDDAHSGSNL